MSAGADRKSGLAAFGGLLGALGASACCILPLALFAAGVTGAWLGTLSALAPYQPFFVVPALAFIAYGFYRVYILPRRVCAAGACARPAPKRLVKSALWLSTVLVAASLAFPYVAPMLLGL